MMPDDEKALEIARRTKKNLDFVYEQKAAGADVEEFTQLLNSMAGMLVALREEYFVGKSVSWDDVKTVGLNPITVVDKEKSVEQPELKRANSFSKLIGNLRHAFAHNNFDLIGESGVSPASQRITGLRVWNVPASTDLDDRRAPERRIWEAEIPEQQLKDIAYLFIDYLEKTRGFEQRR